jgi:hypothetical protein
VSTLNISPKNLFPVDAGLYRAAAEKDACGVAMVARIVCMSQWLRGQRCMPSLVAEAVAPVQPEVTHLHQEQVAQTVAMDLLLHYQELQ